MGLLGRCLERRGLQAVLLYAHLAGPWIQTVRAQPGVQTTAGNEPSPERTRGYAQHRLGLDLGVSNFKDAIGQLEYRYLWASGTQLGVDVRGSQGDLTEMARSFWRAAS